jgi:ABC-2 type transport system ATP-binding protein
LQDSIRIEQPLHARAVIGVQLQATSFQPELKLTEILQLYAGGYGVPMNGEKLMQILRDIKLEDGSRAKNLDNYPVASSSVFPRYRDHARPSLYCSMSRPAALTRKAAGSLGTHGTMRGKDHAVLLTTHSMEEAEAVCDRIAIIRSWKNNSD